MKQGALHQLAFALPLADFALPHGAPNQRRDHLNAPQNAQMVVVFFFRPTKKGRKLHNRSPNLYRKLFKIGIFDPGLDGWKKKLPNSAREICISPRDLGNVNLDSS